MRIAVPITAEGIFCAHFGRCDGLYLAEFDADTGSLERPRLVRRPEHHCDELADWVRDLAVDRLLVGGIGGTARARLHELKIDVVTGLTGRTPAQVVDAYLQKPQGDANACAPSDHRFRHCQP